MATLQGRGICQMIILRISPKYLSITFMAVLHLVSQDMTVIMKISKDMIGGDEMLLDWII